MGKSLVQFHRDDVTVLIKQRVYDGFFKLDKYQLQHACFDGSVSKELTRELILRREAVAAILYDPIHDLIGLIEQFRIGAMDEPEGPWRLEVVAGIMDCGGTAEQALWRELQEEANITQGELRYITNYLSSPGGTNEKLYCYCVLTDLSNAEGIYGLASEGEDIRVSTYPADEVFSTLLTGRWNNAATMICLLWLQRERGTLQSDYMANKQPADK